MLSFPDYGLGFGGLQTMRRMSMAIATAALCFGAAGNVSAQDILRQMYSPVAAATWTGFYAGGNFGYGWARDSSSVDASNGGQAASSFTIKGVNAGGQIGANLQFSGPWMTGIESDIQKSWQRFDGPNGNLSNLNSAAGFALPTTERVSLEWFGSTRARFGYAASAVLIYGTGGVAYGQVKTKGGANGFTQINDSPVKFGWAAGGGIEAMVSRNVSIRGEYLHLDFGGTTEAYGAGGLTANLHQKITNDIVRVGVNYMFR
jgi:outer membrane immunogenic protein